MVRKRHLVSLVLVSLIAGLAIFSHSAQAAGFENNTIYVCKIKNTSGTYTIKARMFNAGPSATSMGIRAHETWGYAPYSLVSVPTHTLRYTNLYSITSSATVSVKFASTQLQDWVGVTKVSSLPNCY